ncbi:uncharacterized protein LOC115211074 isoform X7 [Octopus sinensis]|uniref:Uncharacterized protein LOC115211074 isoform X7 n=1 Tax=Octopus sinensis TaxID=2607531 RepID=A0A7E6EQR3_9MOLL|nr:uncharacterized protein LOC115211074 isoform X7 [Octopus sinensis]
MVGNHCCKIMRKLFICLCALCFSVAAELPQTWNEYQNTNETKGIQSAVAAKVSWNEHQNANETKGIQRGGECGNITSCGEFSAAIKPDMETTKDSGSNAAGTSMPNYAIIILAIIINYLAAILLQSMA